MLKIDNPLRRPALSTLVVLAVACLGITACGSSSKTTSSAGVASAGSPNTSTPGAGRGGARFAALRECLKKNGITLPQRPPGGRRAGGRGFFGAGASGAGGPQLPKGVTQAQYEAAIKKCGGLRGGRFASGGARINNPAFRKAIGKFAECLRSNGIKVPAPNTTGKGPIFNTKGINTTTPQFRSAEMKCRSTLTTVFRGPRGSGPPPAGGGEPQG